MGDPKESPGSLEHWQRGLRCERCGAAWLMSTVPESVLRDIAHEIPPVCPRCAAVGLMGSVTARMRATRPPWWAFWRRSSWEVEVCEREERRLEREEVH